MDTAMSQNLSQSNFGCTRTFVGSAILDCFIPKKMPSHGLGSCARQPCHYLHSVKVPVGLRTRLVFVDEPLADSSFYFLPSGKKNSASGEGACLLTQPQGYCDMHVSTIPICPSINMRHAPTLAYSLAPTQKTKQKLKTFVTLNSSMSCLNILLAGSFLQDSFHVSSDLLLILMLLNHLAPINLYLVY